MRVSVPVWAPPSPLPEPGAPGRAALPRRYLSGLRSTMPITKIFFPGLIPPLMCPQKGTIWKGQRGGWRGSLRTGSGRRAAAGGGYRGEKKTHEQRPQTPDAAALPGEGSTRPLAPGIPASCVNARPRSSAGRKERAEAGTGGARPGPPPRRSAGARAGPRAAPPAPPGPRSPARGPGQGQRCTHRRVPLGHGPRHLVEAAAALGTGGGHRRGGLRDGDGGRRGGAAWQPRRPRGSGGAGAGAEPVQK